MTTVCISADTLGVQEAGGHLWVYLNWALGLRALGCQVIWLEEVDPSLSASEVRANVAALKHRLRAYDLADRVALYCNSGASPLPPAGDCLDLEAAAESDLLLNPRYGTSPDIVRRFRRSALLDIDPGPLQMWMSMGVINVAPHDIYFTIGETVGRPEARIPGLGIKWQHVPPCVALDWWPPCGAPPDAPFSTVSNWYMDESMLDDSGRFYRNDKLSGFLPFMDLPSRAGQPLELALCLGANAEAERATLQKRGWRVRDAWQITATPWDYQGYIQASRGEFSCAKPAYVRLQTAWISDRTICYLASGKPAVVQDTGPSWFLPDSEGLFRFRDLEDAVQCLDRVLDDYERQSKLARALAEDYFDAKKNVRRLLELALA
jgi:hypothetical protein